jgi:FixJ family two-component response regulator
LEQLTPREREVMDRVVMGMLNKQIAADLGISIKTVENHRAQVMEKMQASSLAELVRVTIVLAPRN